jgi:hypothetical protein
MLLPLSSLFNPESIAPTAPRKHRRRFGVIPTEPCRASSMQTLQEVTCSGSEKSVADGVQQ